jgi:hypothetical protein
MHTVARVFLFAIGCIFAAAGYAAALGADRAIGVLSGGIAVVFLHRAAVGFRRRKGRNRPPPNHFAGVWPDGDFMAETAPTESVAVASRSDFDFTTTKPTKRRREPGKRKRIRPIEGDQWKPRGDYEVPVSGESQFQSALLCLVGGSAQVWMEHATTAELVCAPQHPYDFPDTGDVFVYINGLRVGELPDGSAFRRRLMRYGLKGQTTRCNAQIRGGGPRTDGTQRMLGVWLDMPPFRW